MSWHDRSLLEDYYRPMPGRNPEDIALSTIKADVEFLIEPVSRLPTRKEQALKPLHLMFGVPGL
jgi:hypothetical protein